jgi:hypothetical protein
MINTTEAEKKLSSLRSDTLLELQLINKAKAKWRRIQLMIAVFILLIAVSAFMLIVGLKEYTLYTGFSCCADVIAIAIYGLTTTKASCPNCGQKMRFAEGERDGNAWRIYAVCWQCKIKAKTGESTGAIG